MLEQKIKPNREKLKLNDIEVNIRESIAEYDKMSADSNAMQPQIYYRGNLLENHTYELTVKFNSFLPTLFIRYTDINGFILKYGLPIDDAKITIMLPSNNKGLGNIFMQFKVESYTTNTEGKPSVKTYDIVGVLDLNCLFIDERKTYSGMSSYEVYEKFAKETGLGFVTNISGTNDKMNWCTFDKSNLEFLKDVRNHAWISEEHFIWSYIDPYYNLVLCDIETEMREDPENIAWVMDDIFSGENQTGDGIVVGSPVLTTADNYRTSNVYINDYSVRNNSTRVSIEEGYLKKLHYYDIDGNWGERAGNYFKYTLDTIETPGTDAMIRTTSLDDDFYTKNDKTVFGGVIDTINVHPDFIYAEYQNLHNIMSLDKIVLQIVLNKQNFNIQRFGKVQIHIMDNESATDDILNETLSNDYLCTGFVFEYNGNTFTTYANMVTRSVNVAS